MMSVTRCTLVAMSCIDWPASATSREPFCTRSTLLWIKALISRAAEAERWARLRTSLATTAKPRPCSPARAASTAALSARMLVWKAMPSMVPMMSAIWRELVLISSIVATTWAITSPPCVAALLAEAASSLALRADSAVWRTVPVSCSIELAIACRLEAVRSVRWLRSRLLVLMPRLARSQPTALACTPTTTWSMRCTRPSSAFAEGVETLASRRSSRMRPLSSMAETSAPNSWPCRSPCAIFAVIQSSIAVWTTT